MAINTKGFSALVQGQVAAIQASASGLIDFTVGSILRAVVEAFAQVVLWLQGIVLALLATTRAATSTGADLDSFVADFGLTRIGAKASTGSVTFTRFTTTSQGLVPIGALLATSDGSEQFAVVVDTTNPAYSASSGGYLLGAGVATVTVLATATVPGAASNVAANSISTIASAVPGIDTVTNAGAFAGGQDAESDAALRARLVAYFGSLRTSNTASISFAVSSVQSGLRFIIVQGLTYPALTPTNGYFFVIVDDGSGNPPSSLLTAIIAAITVVVGAGIQFSVFGPTPVTINIGMTLTTSSTVSHAAAVSAVQAALTAYIATVPIGTATLALTRLAQVAYDAITGITNVTGITINGVASDLAMTQFQIAEAGTMTVT